VTQPADDSPRALLVCSPGGHLLEMLLLEPAWSDLRRTWITLESSDVRHLLGAEEVILARGPTNRSISAFLSNLRLAWRIVRRERPDAILSTGAALALPFFLAGKLFGARTVYVESLARTSSLSLTGRLVYRLSDAFFIQWPDASRRRRARFAGGLL
jgi:beta-1,4-N-acetylglucosaminyltransferase